MVQRLFQLCGHRYIAVMIALTRVFACVGGFLGVYYVDLSTDLPSAVQAQFNVAAVVAVSIAIVLTIPFAVWNTRRLRPVLRELIHSRPVDAPTARKAGVEAVCFPRRQMICELIEASLCSVIGLWLYLYIFVTPPVELFLQITVAAFMALAAVLLITFFASERWMGPVIHFLMDHGVPIDFETLVPSRLRVRMNVCLSLIIVVTAVMIGSLANRRSLDIVGDPQHAEQAVQNLRRHTVYITVSAVTVGLILSRVLSNSMASRIDHMVAAMHRVRAGDFTERLKPTGTDEIDHLARQFNIMVEQLDHNDRVIRDLNINLERKVRRRTRQLSRSRRSLKRSLRKLKEHDRLKTEFFSNVSHELRTPLAMILSPMERILQTRSERLLPEVRTLLEMMRLNGHRLLRLINQLLDFSKIEAGGAQLRFTDVDVNGLVRNLTAAARPLAETRQIRLHVDLDDNLPVCVADEEKLDTVLTNLLSNAIKFTPLGGEVRVQTARRGNRLRVAVSDTGIGIARQDQHRVFKRFQQVDGSVSREFAGTGLGLPLAKELVELHRGRLRMKSRLGKGTCFWLSIPLQGSVESRGSRAEPREPRAKDSELRCGTVSRPFHDNDRRSPPPSTRPSLGRCAGSGAPRTAPDSELFPERFADLQICNVEDLADLTPREASGETLPRVLIVEDTPEMRYMIGNVLSEEYEILYAGDGEEGLRLVEQEHPDLVLCDVMMPRVDGYEVCRRVKENPETAHIPLVLLTAKAALPMKIEGLQHGADDYLVKPFDEEELRARVRSLLRLRRLYATLHERNRQLEQTLEELRTTQKQLVHSAKMVSLGELAAGLAHEINNSVNAIYNGVQPLCGKIQRLEHLVDESLTRSEVAQVFEKIRMLMDVVEHGADRAVRMIDDLRTFSHPGTETPEWFDVHRELDVCLTLLANSSKNQVPVVKDYQAEGRVYGPAGRLSQVFLNILKNAREALAPSPSPLRRGTTGGRCPEPSGDRPPHPPLRKGGKGVGNEGRVVVSTRDEGEYIVVTIGDDGPGISEEVKSRIFDPFYTTKPPGAGTGLGLSVSYGIVTGLGGTLECRSEPGQGTEFLITLPREVRRSEVRGQESDLAPLTSGL